MIVPTAAQIALANAEIAKHGTGAVDTEKDAHDTEILIATITGLHRKHHFEVNEWGVLLHGELRRNNARARFDIDIHDDRIVARTNQHIDAIAAIAARFANALGRAIADVDRRITITVTFDPAFAERMEASTAK